MIDLLQPTVALSTFDATSVSITWTQPEFSLPVAQYTVQVSETGICPSSAEASQSTTTSSGDMNTTFTGLQSFSQYNITVTANFTPTYNFASSGSIALTTLGSGKLQCFLAEDVLCMYF